jgi:NAD+ kinase
LNDLLIANPSPAAVSRFRMGWLQEIPEGARADPSNQYGTITRFGGKSFNVMDSLNVWSSGMWICTATGSTAAMAAAGGKPMDFNSDELQYLIREHMVETTVMDNYAFDVNNAMIKPDEKLHIRWNSQKGRIFIDGSHLTQNLELGDEIYIDNQGPQLQLFTAEHPLPSEDSA